MVRSGVLRIILMLCLTCPVLAQSRSKSIFDEVPEGGPTNEPALPSESKAAVPDKEAQDSAALLVHELFRAEYADAAPASRVELCNKLLAQAPTTNDLAERYVLLRESASVGASNGDIIAAELAVDHIAANFQTDAHEERLAAYRVLAAIPDMREAVDQHCIEQAEAAMRKDNFDSADQFLQMTGKTPGPQIASQVATLRQEIATRKVQAENVTAALDRLTHQPEDPQTLGFLGRYYCLTKEDWPRGLMMLAKSNDVLKPLAVAELNKAANPHEKLDLTNRWYDARARLTGGERAAVERHCAQLYGELVPKLSGLRLALAQKRSDELRGKKPAPRNANPVPKGNSPPETIAYVCDASGSMMGQPLDLLKAELAKAIGELEATQRFNICFFQRGGVTAFNESALTAATPSNKAKAIAWLGTIIVASNSDPIPSLNLALSQRPQVMYLLTDGAFDDNDAVVAQIAKLNAGKRTRVNTIEFVSSDAPARDRKVCEDVLRAISEANGGRFRVVLTN